MFPWSSDRHVREYAKASSRYYEILRQREEIQMTNNDHIERTKRMIEVMQAYVDGEAIDCKQQVYCDPFVPNWNWASLEFFVAKIPDSINWDHVAPEFKWMARDERDIGYLYTQKPYLKDDVRVADGGKITKPENYASYRKGTADWKESLVIRPGCE